jgi:tetratricopeptide (TPR) repeat protein
MTETLFERYKEALRTGHVAVLRGRLEDAAVAYREAISITADRVVPRTALGRVHLRLGDPQDALDAFDGALALEPDDDASLLGRAQALVVLRRTDEASLAYDHLAGVRAAHARLPDAAEAARRALAIEPTDERRERHARLVEELRATAGEAAAEGASGPATAQAADRELPQQAAAEPGGGADTGAGTPADAPVEGATSAPDPRPDPEALVLALEEAAARGDAEAAAAAALAAARAHREDGRVDAAFDACLLGIGVRPGDMDLHLLLADLAVDRGWTGQAGDAYRQMLRLADLDGDAAGVDLVRRTAAARLPGDPRFAQG